MPVGIPNATQTGGRENLVGFQEQKRNHFEGEVAKVAINGGIVTLSTDSWGWNKLQEKVLNQAILADLLFEVPNVDVPKTLSINDAAHSIDVERARGINLNVSPAFAQGSSQDYFQLKFEAKFNGMYTYLQSIATLHKKYRVLGDNKTDSVFLDPLTGRVTIADSDQMRIYSQNEDPLDIEWKGGLQDVLLGFFTRNMTVPMDMNFAVPGILRYIVFHREEFKTAQDILDYLDLYSFEISAPRVEYINGSRKQHVYDMAVLFKDAEYKERILKMDVDGLSEYQYDKLVSTMYLRNVYRKGEFKEFDERVLGIKSK